MAGKITEALEDAKTLGTTLHAAGPTFNITLSNLILTLLCAFIVVFGLVGSSRWTAKDQDAHETVVAAETAQAKAERVELKTTTQETKTSIKLIEKDLGYVRKDIEEIKNLVKKGAK